jgi:titin
LCIILDVPSEPRDLVVKGCGKDYVDIAWIPPETDGGSEVLQYVIEKRDVTRGIGPWMVCGTVSAAELSCRSNKLFQGNAYQFRVSAENRVGAGPPVEMQEAVVAELPFGELSVDVITCLLQKC